MPGDSRCDELRGRVGVVWAGGHCDGCEANTSESTPLARLSDGCRAEVRCRIDTIRPVNPLINQN